MPFTDAIDGTQDDPSAPMHEGCIVIGQARNIGAPQAMAAVTARFVRYAGCQQLTLWLPQSGYAGYAGLRVLGADGVAIDQASVRSRLNGELQLQWETLAWPAGLYRIEIDHEDGWRHELALHKLPQEPAAPPPSAPAPEADRVLRQQVRAALGRRLLQRLEYDGNCRAGTVTYVDGDLRIRFSHEMGAGDCSFWVQLPTRAQWPAVTGTPLAQRDEIVQFIAERMQRDKAGSGRYEIVADAINFYA